jgi:hypothetical protein
MCVSKYFVSVEGQMSSSTDVFLGGSSQTVSTSIWYLEVYVKDDSNGRIYQYLCLEMLMCDG